MGSGELKIIATILTGTRTKKRKINLLKVAEALNSLYKMHNSIEKVADSVKLSPEMVREFLRLTKLSKEVKLLVRKGFINSVDTGYRISKLSERDQVVFAKAIVKEKLSTDDVRKIVRYKLDNPTTYMAKAIRRVIEAKDTVHFIAYLGINKEAFKKLATHCKSKGLTIAKVVKEIFLMVVSKKHIISFSLNGRVAVVKVTRDGLASMKRKAKSLDVSLSRLCDVLVQQYLSKM